jgi:hypothetical protein
MHDVPIINPLRYFRQQPVMPDVVERSLDRLPIITLCRSK